MAIIPGETGKNIVIDTPQKQKNRRMLLIFVVVMILTGGIIYFGLGGGSSSQPVISPGVSAADEQQVIQNNKTLESLNSVSLDSLIFTDKKWQSLILSDRLPVVVGTKGRDNPFSPF